MFSFHSGSSAVIAHTIWDNAWWSWPFVLKPHWIDVWYLPDGTVSTINLLGNLAVWWGGFACIILLIEKALPLKAIFFKLREKLTRTEAASTATGKPHKWDLAAIFIVTIFFFQWLPYALISRITYIYHFYINVPIICLASAYFINKIWNKKYGKVAAIAYFAVVVAVFVVFYAVISGMPTTRAWIDSLKLFGNSWLMP